MDTPVRIPGAPPEWLVWNEPTRCPYLPAQTAHLPLRLPMRRLKPAELSARLAEGDRRQGLLLYRPTCSSCSACQAIRLDVQEFAPSATHRRVLRRGDDQLEMLIGRPSITEEKVALYNRHKLERGLTTSDGLIDAEGYEQFLAESCTDTIEIRYLLNGLLLGVAITDRAADALSAVYCFYDPSFSRLGLGTYSVLKQVALCRQWGLRYLYLGLYVAGNRAMAYKARYLPHQRLIDGAWRRFDAERKTKHAHDRA
ncbi:arginyltransferase [bacterium]|nr:arginyltransferase [bacterium]